MIKSLIGALIFFGIGIFVGIIMCVELGIYDAYKTDKLESELGFPFYTEQQCVQLVKDGKLLIHDDKTVIEPKKEVVKEDKTETLSLREQLKKDIENKK